MSYFWITHFVQPWIDASILKKILGFCARLHHWLDLLGHIPVR